MLHNLKIYFGYVSEITNTLTKVVSSYLIAVFYKAQQLHN